MSLTIRKVAGALGAEISGADLSADLPDSVIAKPLKAAPAARGDTPAGAVKAPLPACTKAPK